MSVYKFQNTAFDALVHETGSKKALVLLDGMPSDPQKKIGLMKEFFERGHDVFFPRYEGTWESGGVFLERNPCESIAEFINQLRDGLPIAPGRVFVANKISVLGASFGGGIALSISNNPNISRVCAISPVINFTLVQGIRTLENYVHEAYGEQYRFDSAQWDQLISNKFYNPGSEKIENPNSVLIIAGENDDQIKISDLREYAKSQGLRLETFSRGHMTLSKIDTTIMHKIDAFLSEAE
jgi:esterase/lipase